ncbi:hypothetical protein D3C87_1650940 [compost metagenome]
MTLVFTFVILFIVGVSFSFLVRNIDIISLLHVVWDLDLILCLVRFLSVSVLVQSGFKAQTALSRTL